MSSFWALPPGWAQSPEGRSERKREPGGRSPFSSPPLRFTSSQILTPPENDATCPQRGRSGGVRCRGDQREGLGHPGPGPNSSPGSEQEDLGLQQQQTRRLTEPDTAHIVQSHSTAGTVSTPILQIRRLSADQVRARSRASILTSLHACDISPQDFPTRSSLSCQGINFQIFGENCFGKGKRQLSYGGEWVAV